METEFLLNLVSWENKVVKCVYVVYYLFFFVLFLLLSFIVFYILRKLILKHRLLAKQGKF